MGQGCLHVVRGKRIVPVDGRTLHEHATDSDRVIVDFGAGDGRWVYRLARAHPTWTCMALDADAAGMAETSRRAARKPARGGTPKAWFVRAALEALPEVLPGLADELHVHLPWGSLLRAVLTPEAAALRRIVRLCRPGAAVCVRINAAVLDDAVMLGRLGLPAAGKQTLETRLGAGYAAAGIRVTIAEGEFDVMTSWARRLGAGRPLRILALDGIVEDKGTHGPAEALRWCTSHRSEVSDEA